MKLWITGENGFVARAFTRHLGHKHTIENSHLNGLYDYWRQKKFSPEHRPEIDIFDPTLHTIIERSDVECIVHTATFIQNDPEKSHIMVRNNIEGSYYVCQIAKKLNIPIIFINYENHHNNVFSWTQECIINMLESMGVKYVILGTQELFGPEDFHGAVSQLLMSSVGKLDTADIVTNIDNKRAFTFIDDFLDGVDIILRDFHNYYYKYIPIVNNENTSLEDIIDHMSNIMEITLHYNIQEDSEEYIQREREVHELKGWKPKVSLEAGLEITRDLINDRSR